MPLFDMRCLNPDCGAFYPDRYFATFKKSEEPQKCLECGSRLTKDVPLVSFTEFKPFFTNNIAPDGSGIYVRSRDQLRELTRRYKLREVGNDPVRALFGSSEKSVPRELQRPSPVRRQSRSLAVPASQAASAEEFAKRTEFGQRSSR